MQRVPWGNNIFLPVQFARCKRKLVNAKYLLQGYVTNKIIQTPSQPTIFLFLRLKFKFHILKFIIDLDWFIIILRQLYFKFCKCFKSALFFLFQIIVIWKNILCICVYIVTFVWTRRYILKNSPGIYIQTIPTEMLKEVANWMNPIQLLTLFSSRNETEINFFSFLWYFG